MRVLAVSVAPLFPDRVMGGSQRILMQVVDALTGAGHEVSVLCSDTGSNFQTSGGASVEAVLRLRGSFPAQYQAAPHRLVSVWRELASAAEWADRAYLHADAIYMRGALGELPVVRSLHDFVYEEALLSAFTLPAQRTIVPSNYMRDCIEASAGTVTDPGELVVIPNGVESPGWPVEPLLPDDIAPRQPDDLVLLHPHRLQPEKGVEQSMRIALEVQRRIPDRRIRLLVPAVRPDASADDAAMASGPVMEMARALGADKLLGLHEWLSPDRMPGYFAAGDVTLCPGSFIDAFGLVPLESVVAGTPAVCASVGALREQRGLSGISHFDFGDLQAAADAVEKAVSADADMKQAAAEVLQRYDVTEMRSAYVEAITDDLPGPSDRRARNAATGSRWCLAPWCYVTGDRIYHDYLARFESFPDLTRAFVGGEHVTIADGNIPEPEIQRAQIDGFIVPA